jgi:hypothetical protein
MYPPEHDLLKNLHAISESSRISLQRSALAEAPPENRL